MANKYLPYYMNGEIVKGFGRGSKELGCPTGMLSVTMVIVTIE